jgi:hypothetical protein
LLSHDEIAIIADAKVAAFSAMGGPWMAAKFRAQTTGEGNRIANH